MKLVKVNHPFYTSRGIDRLMNEFFNEDWGLDRYAKNELTSSPSTNVYETEDAFKVEVSVPGYEKDQINLDVENDVLTIKAELAKSEDKEFKYVRREFSASGFEKSFKLSKNINQDKIEASFKNGVLVVDLPKKEEAILIKREIKIA